MYLCLCGEGRGCAVYAVWGVGRVGGAVYAVGLGEGGGVVGEGVCGDGGVEGCGCGGGGGVGDGGVVRGVRGVDGVG